MGSSSLFDTFPPGACTCITVVPPGLFWYEAGTAATSSVELREIGVTTVPSNSTEDPVTNPDPFTETVSFGAMAPPNWLAMLTTASSRIGERADWSSRATHTPSARDGAGGLPGTFDEYPANTAFPSRSSAKATGVNAS